tara:strand:+ start:1883 stop:2017 length:135 start_codon:yes stop_codon:yes gene_type:complete
VLFEVPVLFEESVRRLALTAPRRLLGSWMGRQHQLLALAVQQLA